MFHSRPCLLNEGAAPREPSQSWPQTTMATRRNQLNSLLEQMGLGPRLQKGAVLSGDSGAEVKRYAYPLSAYCLLIACSGVLVTIVILNEMRLDYSPIHAGFAYKTTEQLWHWRALLRCIVCSHHDAVLVAVVCSFRIGVPAIARNCARASCTRWCGDTRGLCALRWCWAMNVRGYRSSGSGAVLCADPPALVWTAVANRLSLTRWLLPNRAHGLAQDECKVKPV
jgi:hypothetical protein